MRVCYCLPEALSVLLYPSSSLLFLSPLHSPLFSLLSPLSLSPSLPLSFLVSPSYPPLSTILVSLLCTTPLLSALPHRPPLLSTPLYSCPLRSSATPVHSCPLHSAPPTPAQSSTLQSSLPLSSFLFLSLSLSLSLSISLFLFVFSLSVPLFLRLSLPLSSSLLSLLLSPLSSLPFPLSSQLPLSILSLSLSCLCRLSPHDPCRPKTYHMTSAGRRMGMHASSCAYICIYI